MEQHETLLGAGAGFLIRFWGAELGAILAIFIFGSPAALGVQLIAPELMPYTLVSGLVFSVYVATRTAVESAEEVPGNDEYAADVLMLFAISNALFTSVVLGVSTLLAGLVSPMGVLSIWGIGVAMLYPEVEISLLTRYQKSPIATPIYYLVLGLIILVGLDVDPDDIPTFAQSSIIPSFRAS